MKDETDTVRVRVKSRTGDAYFRGPRSWPATSWARCEITISEFELLSHDQWLDVVLLEEHESIEAPERSPSELLEEARQEIAALRAEIAALKESGSGNRRSRGAP